MPPRESHPTSPLRPLPVRHLPLLRHAIDELGIRAAVDRLSAPDPRHLVSDGDCVAVMIMNILHGRVALYEMGTWLADTDVDLLLGEGTPAECFHDDRLGHALDRLFNVGTEYLFSEVARGVLRRPCLGTSYAVHMDTTSVSLHGAYEEDPQRPWPEGAPQPARGFSKDKRPDLKQLIFGLSVHGPTRIPLGFNVLDGNTADPKANRFQIESLAQLLPAEHDVTLVADCKFVDGVTLGAAAASGLHYVSLLPHTFGLRAELVEDVRTKGTELAHLGTFPGRTLDLPSRTYRGVSFVRPFPMVMPGGAHVEQAHRFLVVRSSSQEAEFDETIDRRADKEKASLDRTLEKLTKREFACETDLRAELARAVQRVDYHEVVTDVREEDVARKRSGPGRPRKGDAVPMERVWRLAGYGVERDAGRISVARFHAAHFVLVTDHTDATAWDDERIFTTWRGQQSIEGHAGFRWLKGVADVAPVFLDLPHRIQALALVFMLALMVRNWMEAHIRATLARTGKLLPNFLDKPIARPTAENVWWLFRSVIILATVEEERIAHRDVHFLEGYALDVLEIFGVDERLFTRPPRKSVMLTRAISAM